MLTRPRPRFGPAASPAAVGVAMLVSLAAFTGCTAESPTAPTVPAATPTYHPATPTPASDADVEAAIASFQEYLLALNGLDPANTSTVDSFLATTSGDQLETEREFIELLRSRHWTVEGTAVARFIRAAPTPGSVHQITLEACVDTTALHYFDAARIEHGPPLEDRLQVLEVRMRSANGGWLVDETSPLESESASCA